jgi:hypothetical protein
VIPFPSELVHIFLGIHSLPKLSAQPLEFEKTAGSIRRGIHSGGLSNDPLGKVEPFSQGNGTDLRLVEIVG